jgi:hypothetical protein
MLPGKDFPDVWICSGTNPNFDSNFVYKSVWGYTLLKVISFVLHIVIAIRIKVYKWRIDQENIKNRPRSTKKKSVFRRKKFCDWHRWERHSSGSGCSGILTESSQKGNWSGHLQSIFGLSWRILLHSHQTRSDHPYCVVRKNPFWQKIEKSSQKRNQKILSSQSSILCWLLVSN